MNKGIFNISVVIILVLTIIFTLLVFLNYLSRFSDLDRYYIFWQGYYLGDSYVLKFKNGYLGDLEIYNVPFSSSENPYKVGKSFYSNGIIEAEIFGPRRLKTRLEIIYSNGIERYRVIGKYSE